MSPRLPLQSERIRRWRGWMISAALLALTPKCALCLLAYAGVGTVLGIGGPELCGSSNSATGYLILAAGLIGAAFGVGFIGRFLRSRRRA